MENNISERFTSFEEVSEYLAAIPQFTGTNTGFSCGVDRARLLLDFAGHPERGLNIIHVAGSNGKGSVCALLECALRSAGYMTGLFTSPHLYSVRERIRFQGELIGEDDFVRLMNMVYEAEAGVRRKYAGFQAAYFEYFFIAALIYYKEKRADAVILETGLGGSLDATNACENKALCVITPISLEHTHILGDTLTDIAAEKGGIIRGGTPAVVYEPDFVNVKRVFEEAARESSSPLHFFSKKEVSIASITDENIDFSLHNEYYRNVTVSLPMPAVYEAYNAGLALKALAVLADKHLPEGFDKDKLLKVLPDIVNGFKAFQWPGRMQKTTDGVYTDGAHNPAGIRAFTESVAAFAGDKENILLFAVSDDKDAKDMVRILCESGLFSSVVVTLADETRGADVREIARLFTAAGMADVTVKRDTWEAYCTALDKPHDYLFCTGSLFLPGKLMK